MNCGERYSPVASSECKKRLITLKITLDCFCFAGRAVAQGVWGNVDKAEYETKYMNHSNQTIANLANCRREEHALVNDINTSQAKLNAHNREYTNHLLLEPKELLKVLVNMNNTITSLQSTVTSLQSTVTSLQSAVSKITEEKEQLEVELESKLSQAEYRSMQRDVAVVDHFTKPEAAKLAELKKCCDMKVFSDSNRMKKEGNRIMRDGNAWGGGHCTSAVCLPSTVVSHWQVVVEVSGPEGMFLGVIGTNDTRVLGYGDTREHNTSYGWGTGRVVSGGNTVVSGSPDYAWRSGDVADFSYDPFLKSLRMYHHRSGYSQSIAVPLNQAFVHLCFLGLKNSVAFFPANPFEWQYIVPCSMHSIIMNGKLFTSSPFSRGQLHWNRESLTLEHHGDDGVEMWYVSEVLNDCMECVWEVAIITDNANNVKIGVLNADADLLSVESVNAQFAGLSRDKWSNGVSFKKFDSAFFSSGNKIRFFHNPVAARGQFYCCNAKTNRSVHVQIQGQSFRICCILRSKESKVKFSVDRL
jgi:hypothetical protein